MDFERDKEAERGRGVILATCSAYLFFLCALCSCAVPRVRKDTGWTCKAEESVAVISLPVSCLTGEISGVWPLRLNMYVQGFVCI